MKKAAQQQTVSSSLREHLVFAAAQQRLSEICVKARPRGIIKTRLNNIPARVLMPLKITKESAGRRFFPPTCHRITNTRVGRALLRRTQ